jgi:hypothetical protein
MKRFILFTFALIFIVACKPLALPTVVSTETPTLTPTLTPTPFPTATPAPTYTATVDPLKTALLYSDDFSNDQSGWTVSADDQSKYYYSNGEYFIQALKSNFYFYVTGDHNFTDSVLTVDLRHVSGDDKLTGGMIFWHYYNSDNFFALSVSGDGSYSIHRFLKGVFGEITLPAFSPDLKTNGSTNQITIEQNGDRSDIYFNGRFASSFSDPSLPYGSVGMGAYPDLSSDVEVAFDNLAVYKYDLNSAYTPPEPVLTPTPAFQAITWDELTRFLDADHTNWHSYDENTYNCVDFAVDLVAAARQQNIDAKVVGVDFVGQQKGHAFVVFKTSDRGNVFVEPQGDNTYSNVAVGNDLCDSWGDYECMGTISNIEYYGECDHQHNCTVELP